MNKVYYYHYSYYIYKLLHSGHHLTCREQPTVFLQRIISSVYRTIWLKCEFYECSRYEIKTLVPQEAAEEVRVCVCVCVCQLTQMKPTLWTLTKTDSEAALDSVCQTVKCCLFSLSSLHHPLPIQRHTSLWGDSFPPVPRCLQKLAQRTKVRGWEEVGRAEGEEGRIASDTQSLLQPVRTKPSSGASAQPLVPRLLLW